MFALALTYFLIANPIGNAPAFVALVKDFSFKRQCEILFREAIFALLLALFFQYFGELFLTGLSIDDFTVTITGGLLLLLVSYSMIFPKRGVETKETKKKTEPFIVPIATPIISGPGLLAVIMMTAKLEENNLMVSSAIGLAWIGVTAIMTFAPYLQKVLGERGLVALEQIMGMILALISMGMVVKGINLFVKSLT